MPKAPIPRRPFTEKEHKQALALARCRFLPASPDKRFARDIVTLSTADAAAERPVGITERQAEHLQRLCWKYRRQIPEDLVPASAP
jgi:hypothetical protein